MMIEGLLLIYSWKHATRKVTSTRQVTGEGQRVQPVSLVIHESTENLKFRQIGRFSISINDYVSAHFHAQEREAFIRRDLGITGGFAGGALTSTVPRSR